MPMKTFLIRHRWAVLAAAYSAAMVLFLAKRGIDRFRHPFPHWMTESPRWYDDALGVGLFAVAMAASVAYLRRIWREERSATVPGQATRLMPWRQRIELRIVLYCLAAFLVLQFPLAVFQALRATHDEPPPEAGTFVSLFPVGAWLYLLLGVVLIIYDRRRIRREAARAGDARAATSSGDIR